MTSNAPGAPVVATAPSTGRPPATTREQLEQVAFDLFDRKGFDQTTVDEIAAAAGIARRTFFRYHASKKDLVWGDFDTHLKRLHTRLADYPPGVPVMAALRDAVVWFNELDPIEIPRHRRRMRLILRVPALQADATLRYASWRSVVVAFVAERTAQPQEALGPRLVGHVALGAAMAAYEQWLADDTAQLPDVMDAAMTRIGDSLVEA